MDSRNIKSSCPNQSVKEELQGGMTENRMMNGVCRGRALESRLHVSPTDPPVLHETNLSLSSQHPAQGRRFAKLQKKA